MRRMPILAAVTFSLLVTASGVALAGAEHPVEQSGRRLDFDSRAALRCSTSPHLVRTAYVPGQDHQEKPVSLRACFTDTDRIGAGYTQFVRNSAVRHPHHRMKG
ncbi:hypothetical protein HW511_06670 [Asaia siamensis]|uniref:Secreted protein n=1 Tax=Asaia siamensis TaxID=110479 RepID=A0ABQ1LSA0_9PROT|nr:hypothetical protein [Asaia siamensis]GBR05061.1 hypothetical protein AA0323_0914 [Asaia siamensis NRIC 0323]GGC26822.1 hypothetical protein GCM10007207_10340 [Asaia siamensis]